jgi:dTDP-4-amino-4,6-dideoxygalactose transaminase
LLVGYPNVGRRDVFDQLVDEMFQRNWFTNNGNLVQRLEATLADYLEVKHCVLVCNATIGLQLVCQALELQGEVIVPAYTFVATAHAARAAGLDIVFADVLPETHLIDPKCVEQLMSSKTAAIIGVHVWGQACDVSAIGTIANNHGVRHMYDAAHAFGCRHLGTSIGNFGECEVFSFHATKFFNTFEGGAITTNNDQLAEKLRLARNFGFSGPDCVVSMGTNAKMSEVCAAMGLANFSEIPRFIETNRQHHLSYKKGLSDIKGIQLLDYAQQDRSNWQYIVIEINAEEFGVSRDELYIALHKENVFARRYFKPGVHRMEPYCSIEKKSEISLAITERLCDQILCLPNGSGIQLGDVERICGIIRAMSLRNAAQSE